MQTADVLAGPTAAEGTYPQGPPWHKDTLSCRELTGWCVLQDAVKVMAKSLIRNRHAVTKLHGLKSQLQAVSLRIQVRWRSSTRTLWLVTLFRCQQAGGGNCTGCWVLAMVVGLRQVTDPLTGDLFVQLPASPAACTSMPWLHVAVCCRR